MSDTLESHRCHVRVTSQSFHIHGYILVYKDREYKNYLLYLSLVNKYILFKK